MDMEKQNIIDKIYQDKELHLENEELNLLKQIINQKDEIIDKQAETKNSMAIAIGRQLEQIEALESENKVLKESTILLKRRLECQNMY